MMPTENYLRYFIELLLWRIGNDVKSINRNLILANWLTEISLILHKNKSAMIPELTCNDNLTIENFRANAFFFINI